MLETAIEGGTRPGLPCFFLRWIYEFIRQSGRKQSPAIENISPRVKILAEIRGNLRGRRRRIPHLDLFRSDVWRLISAKDRESNNEMLSDFFIRPS